MRGILGLLAILLASVGTGWALGWSWGLVAGGALLYVDAVLMSPRDPPAPFGGRPTGGPTP